MKDARPGMRRRVAEDLRERRQRLALAMAAPEGAAGFRSQWTTVDGVPMHARVRTTSSPQGPPVVLVHGLAVSHRYLMPTAARLAAHHDVWAVDLPGFGLSGAPDRVLHTTEHADALARWLDANHVGPAVMVGNSYGCQVLVDLVTRAPQRCTALVLSGPTINPHARTAARQLLAWAWDVTREDPIQLPILLRDVRDAGPARVWATFLGSLRDLMEEMLPRVSVPTLVLRGAVEPVVPAGWAREAAGLVPGGQMATVPASPHNAVFVAPDALAALIRSFLSDLEDG